MPVQGGVRHQPLGPATPGKLCPTAQAWAELCYTKMLLLQQPYLALTQQAASFWVQWPWFAVPQVSHALQFNVRLLRGLVLNVLSTRVKGSRRSLTPGKLLCCLGVKPCWRRDLGVLEN